MIDRQEVDPLLPRFQDDRHRLERRGIHRGPKGYTTQQLLDELSHRGWHVDVYDDRVIAVKNSGAAKGDKTELSAGGADQIANLVTVLADAIMFDESRDPSRSLAFPSDIVVKDPEGWPIAMIEIKNRLGLTRSVATAIRRNMLGYGLVSRRAPFFLVVSQNAGYVWRQQSNTVLDDPPTTEFPMGPVLRHYARWLAPDQRLSGSSLEFVVANWLADQATGHGPDLQDATAPLDEIGFLEAIEDGIVTINERT